MCTDKNGQSFNFTNGLNTDEDSCQVVGNHLAFAYQDADPFEFDLGSRPSSTIALVEAFGRIEDFDPSCQAFAIVVASSLVISIHPSFEAVDRIQVEVDRIVKAASVDHKQVATSYQVVGSPFVFGHILVATSFVVSPSFQDVDHTLVAEVDSQVIAFLPSLVTTYLPSSVEEAYHPS